MATYKLNAAPTRTSEELMALSGRLLQTGLEGAMRSDLAEQRGTMRERLLIQLQDKKSEQKELDRGVQLALADKKYEQAKELQKLNTAAKRELKLLEDTLFEQGSKGGLTREKTRSEVARQKLMGAQTESTEALTGLRGAQTEAAGVGAEYKRAKLAASSKTASPFSKAYFSALNSVTQGFREPEEVYPTVLPIIAPLATTKEEQDTLGRLIQSIRETNPDAMPDDLVEQILNALPPLPGTAE